jgi:hypothetical protein
MTICLNASKLFRVGFVLILTLLLPAWTCTAIIGFNSCPGSGTQPQIVSLSPDSISADTDSAKLTVNGSSFLSTSQILWNGHPLPTTFTDSSHLRTTITQQTFKSFGGAVGSNVLISVMSPASTFVVGCRGGVQGR